MEVDEVTSRVRGHSIKTYTDVEIIKGDAVRIANNARDVQQDADLDARRLEGELGGEQDDAKILAAGIRAVWRPTLKPNMSTIISERRHGW